MTGGDTRTLAMQQILEECVKERRTKTPNDEEKHNRQLSNENTVCQD